MTQSLSISKGNRPSSSTFHREIFTRRPSTSSHLARFRAWQHLRAPLVIQVWIASMCSVSCVQWLPLGHGGSEFASGVSASIAAPICYSDDPKGVSRHPLFRPFQIFQIRFAPLSILQFATGFVLFYFLIDRFYLWIGALAWSSSIFSSGSRDKSILPRDIRAHEDFVSKLSGHKSEVYELKWSYDNHELASGGNDNRVCNLVWSKNVNELVSTHGYSQNQIILATLTGHSYRVLYLSISPNGHIIVTRASDETLRFWNAFPSPKSQNTESDIGASSTS
ncbi:hypothetical protein UlMin_019114 [Ulmus minor]